MCTHAWREGVVRCVHIPGLKGECAYLMCAPPRAPACLCPGHLPASCVPPLVPPSPPCPGHLPASCVPPLLPLSLPCPGHLPTLRLFQALSLRRTCGAKPGLHLTYGSHMAVNLALGFLFLGAGNATFGSSNSAVAALLIALFPRFPHSPADNCCHLQVGCRRQ